MVGFGPLDLTLGGDFPERYVRPPGIESRGRVRRPGLPILGMYRHPSWLTRPFLVISDSSSGLNSRPAPAPAPGIPCPSWLACGGRRPSRQPVVVGDLGVHLGHTRRFTPAQDRCRLVLPYHEHVGANGPCGGMCRAGVATEMGSITRPPSTGCPCTSGTSRRGATRLSRRVSGTYCESAPSSVR